MAASTFTRLILFASRIVLVLAFLPWMSGAHTAPLSQPQSDPIMSRLAPGWTASQWSEVIRMVRADLAASPAPAAQSWEQRLNMSVPDEAYQTGFGWSAAVDGDTLVVGAFSGRVWDATDSRYYYSGTAYVFKRSSSGWSSVQQVGKLYPADYKSANSFGMSVAIDGLTIVVGAPDSHVPYAGMPGGAYVFVETGDGWKQATKLLRSSISPSDAPRLGMSVDIDGNAIVVGAPMEDVDYGVEGYHYNEGSVYVFQRPAGGWSDLVTNESGYLRTSDAQPEEMFGYSVAISGNTILAGKYAHSPDTGGADEHFYGKVYVFNLPAGNLWGTMDRENASFTASNPGAHEYFGWSVALDDDLAVIGAPGEYSSDANGEESAYIFERPEGGWTGGNSYTETVRIVASDSDPYYTFGNSVAVSGDVVVVGAPWTEIGGGSKTGAVYIYSKPASGWVNLMTETQKLIADDKVAGEEFGYSVFIDGETIISGAISADNDMGATYVFDSNSTPDTKIFTYLPLTIR